MSLRYLVLISCYSVIISLTSSQNDFTLDDCELTVNESQEIRTLSLSKSAICVIMPKQRLSNIDIEFMVMVENFNLQVRSCYIIKLRSMNFISVLFFNYNFLNGICICAIQNRKNIFIIA